MLECIRMKIKYLGHSSFLIEGKTTSGESVSVVTDPFDPKSVGFPYPSVQANIITSSHEGHGDHDWYQGVKQKGESSPIIINTPGEYEVSGLSIFGFKSYHDDKKGAERGLNTIYVYDFEVARIAHLGDLGHLPEPSLIEALDGTEILMIPVGGVYTIGPKRAIEIIEKIEPLIVIPMHYKTKDHSATFDKLATLEDFLKEVCVKHEPQKELRIKSKTDLPEELTFITLEK